VWPGWRWGTLGAMLTWVRLILRYRWLVLIGLLLISIVSGASLSRAVIATSMEKMLLGDSPAYRSYRVRAAEFGGDELLIVAYDEPEPLSEEALERLESAVGRLSALPEVGGVISLLDAVTLDSSDDGMLVVQRYAEAAHEQPERRAELTAALRAEPSVRGLVLSESGPYAAIAVAMRPDPGRSAEQGPRLVRQVSEILEEEGLQNLRRGGYLAMISAVMDQSTSNVVRLFPLTILAVVGSVFLLFRRLLPVLVAMGVSLMAVLWTMGFAVVLDRELNIFASIVPAVVMVVAISDTIHLWSAYLIELSAGHDKLTAIERSASEVGTACVLTSATTFLGFISLTLIPTPVYQQVGTVLGFGVSVALLITVTLMPVLMSLLDEPVPTPERADRADRLDSALDRLAGLTSQRAGAIILLFSAFTAVMLYGVSQVHLETEILTRLSPRTIVRQDAEFIRENFAGSNIVELYVDAPDGVMEPGVIHGMAALQADLEQVEGVDAVLSVVDVLGALHEALGGTGALPDSREALAQYLLLFEVSGGDDLDGMLNFERTTARMIARLDSGALRQTADVAEQARALASQHLPPGVGFEATGLTTLFGGFLDDLLTGQRSGLLFSIGSIGVMMILGLRSLRNGLLSILPNVLPLLAVGGAAGLMWDRVDSDTVIPAMIAIGIGVDDTIHFLVRMRLESQRAPLPEAIRQTLRFAGRGILFTTIILVLGFLPLALSDYFSIWVMGTFIPAALIIALATDLLLVPALAARGFFRFHA
jgi:predicted RND superfamily exporter protein